jgi:hypothetical protein
MNINYKLTHNKFVVYVNTRHINVIINEPPRKDRAFVILSVRPGFIPDCNSESNHIRVGANFTRL